MSKNITVAHQYFDFSNAFSIFSRWHSTATAACALFKSSVNRTMRSRSCSALSAVAKAVDVSVAGASSPVHGVVAALAREDIASGLRTGAGVVDGWPANWASTSTNDKYNHHQHHRDDSVVMRVAIRLQRCRIVHDSIAAAGRYRVRVSTTWQRGTRARVSFARLLERLDERATIEGNDI